MPAVEISGWNEGFQKISCTHLLQGHAGLSLRDAKSVTDRVLNGERATVIVDRLEVAARLAELLSEIGARTTVVDRDYDV